MLALITQGLFTQPIPLTLVNGSAALRTICTVGTEMYTLSYKPNVLFVGAEVYTVSRCFNVGDIRLQCPAGSIIRVFNVTYGLSESNECFHTPGDCSLTEHTSFGYVPYTPTSPPPRHTVGTQLTVKSLK